MNKGYLDIDDVCKLLERKRTYSYAVIKRLNNELEEKGYIINPGKVPAKYFYERTGLDPVEL